MNPVHPKKALKGKAVVPFPIAKQFSRKIDTPKILKQNMSRDMLHIKAQETGLTVVDSCPPQVDYICLRVDPTLNSFERYLLLGHSVGI